MKPQRKGKWELRKNKAGYYYVVLIASNGRILFHTEAFETKNIKNSKIVARKTIESIKRQVFNSELILEIMV